MTKIKIIYDETYFVFTLTVFIEIIKYICIHFDKVLRMIEKISCFCRLSSTVLYTEYFSLAFFAVYRGQLLIRYSGERKRKIFKCTTRLQRYQRAAY